jgi:hypothetical protein
MGAALVAPGEALVDAVTVRLVGDDEDAAVGGSRRGGKQEGTGNECGGKSHGDTGRGKGSPRTDRPKRLKMINHEPAGRQRVAGFGGLIGPKSGTSKALTTSPRYRNGGTMNGLLAICAICREIIS